ncbi:hypothetical protein A1Q2_07617 [Trichosporon asahii var. asahii CBS 8904]|uniref:Peptidase A1 domain-containing protein n=1 Tax=Trichosporon asahii var. asahii (strain CBS 8904) TaxID=1220162 RepID=K1VG79_TRIAC|nr:hypothetical protein A1Q2_07617 [Trichosporon asahii var. asahii CBS 8904]
MAAVFAVPPQSHNKTNTQRDSDTGAAQSAMSSSGEAHHDHLLIDLAIGIPPQHVKARASFSSADTVVFAGPSASFDPSSSTSYVQGLRDGKVSIEEQRHAGNISHDRIEIDGWVLTEPVVSKAGPSDHGAYLGLGYKSFVGPDNEALVHRLSTKWEKPYYGLYLPPQAFHSSIANSWRRTSPQEGSVRFGQADPRYAKGSVHWLESDSRPDGAWSVQFDGISIDGKIVPMKDYPEATLPEEDSTAFRTTSIRSGSRTNIFIDKTSRKYVLPDAMVDGLMDEVEGAVKWGYGPSNHTIWEVPCEAKNRIELKLGMRDYRLRPDDWMFTTDNRCFSDFAYLSESKTGQTQLGTRFLEAFYTLWNLNPPEVGLMRLDPGLPSPRTEPPPTGHVFNTLIDETLHLTGPIPSLGLARAGFQPAKQSPSTQYCFLVVFGVCASVYCVFRLWRRGKMPFSPRSPRYSPISKELPV